MTKAILEFDLTDPHDADHFKLANKAMDYKCFFESFDQDILRQYSKYGLPDEFCNDATSLIHHLWEKYRELALEYGICV